MTKTNTMTRGELRDIFKRHRGEMSALARRLKVSREAISGWLRGGRGGKSLERAIRRTARRLAEKNHEISQEGNHE